MTTIGGSAMSKTSTPSGTHPDSAGISAAFAGASAVMSSASASVAGAAAEHGAARTSSKAAARGLPLLDKLTIFAIAAVVALVSIQRLRAFGLRENELDAMRMLRTLSSLSAPTGADAKKSDLAALVAHDSSLARRLEDLERMPDGRLRRHGYLFDVTLLRPGEPMLRAWPWNYGQTGRGAFVWTPQRGLLGFDNGDGRFSGSEAPPAPGDIGPEWLRMAHRRGL
jgi:hypothetical protein